MEANKELTALDWVAMGDYVKREGIDPEIALEALVWCGIVPDEQQRIEYLTSWQKWSKS